MPPRHAYWTILVDEQPTAFRAHDPEDLRPTLNRLKEKHPSAVMKWFERGKLWDSREAAREAGFGQGERRWEGPRQPRDGETKEPGAAPRRETPSAAGRERPRDKNWRPGGEHRDPHQKYKDAKKAKWQRFKQNVRKGWEARRGEDERPRDERPRDERPRDERPRDERPRDERPRDNRPRDNRPRDNRRPDDRTRDDRRRDRPWDRRGQPAKQSWSGQQSRSGERPPRREGWAPKPSWSDRPRDSRQGDRDGRSTDRPDRPTDRDRGWRPKGPPRGDRPQGNGPGRWPSRRPDDRVWRDRPPRDRDRAPGSSRPYDKDSTRPRGPKAFGGQPSGGRKPWAAKPPGGRPKGKPFGPKGPRGPGRPPGRGPRKPRDDE